MQYFRRIVDQKLLEWKADRDHKPLLLRGPRQVGKSSTIREFGKSFRYFAEVNFEKTPSLKQLFSENIDIPKLCEKLGATLSVPIVPGKTLLFLDEIQSSPEALRSLRYFREEMPALHVVAAGSLLEFALQEIPSFAVGRIRSLYMYPFSFDEFLEAQGLRLQVDYKRKASAQDPLPGQMHIDMVEQLKMFYLIGGMPAAVAKWIEKRNYADCVQIHNDILDTYQDDFAKYKKRVSPVLLRQTLKSVAMQAGRKFVFSHVADDVRASSIKDALQLLTLAGLIFPVIHSNGNGVPLGAEENGNFTKHLFLDFGLMLTMLSIPAKEILLASDIELVNKGAISEMFAGLEFLKYADCFLRPDLHYWQVTNGKGNAEVDYLVQRHGKVVPIEIKASTSGAMQSLWVFMQKKKLHDAWRCSLENFGAFDHTDKQDDNAVRHVEICPLYALSNIAGGAFPRKDEESVQVTLMATPERCPGSP